MACRTHDYERSRYCGVKVCMDCGHHDGLVCCYCGWSLYGGDGRRELEELGEAIEPTDY